MFIVSINSNLNLISNDIESFTILTESQYTNVNSTIDNNTNISNDININNDAKSTNSEDINENKTINNQNISNNVNLNRSNTIANASKNSKSIKKWYIIHVAANCEKHVQTEIEQKAIEDGMSHMIEEIFVPSYKATVIQRGKKQEIDKKTMPGYVLVKMLLNTHTISLIKSIKKVSNFLGGTKPTAISDNEVAKIRETILLQASAEEIIPYNIGDAVEINTGPFETFQGNIKEIDLERKKLKIIVYVFGRQNIIELNMNSVKKI